MTRKYETVTSGSRLAAWSDKLAASKLFAIDTETTSTDPVTCSLVGVSLAVLTPDRTDVEACYIPVGHTDAARGLYAQLPIRDVLRMLRPHLVDPSRAKVLQNAVYDLCVLGRYDVPFANVHDTMMLSFVRNPVPHGHGMDALAARLLGHDTVRFEDVVLTDPLIGMKNFADVRLDHATYYAAEDTDVTLRLFLDMRRGLRQSDPEGWRVYDKIDRHLVHPLSDMKLNGVGLDVAGCRKMARAWSRKADAAMAIVQQYAPGINISSPKQLSELLYDKLELPILARTKTQAPSTNDKTLELLADEHECVAAIREYRMYSKLISTYVGKEAMPALVNPSDGRIHCNINSTFTATARFSSSGPNLQTIPSPNNEGDRADIGVALRSAFFAPPGFVLVGADYSQIELRVLAQVTQDPTLIDAFRNGEDIHARTAAEVFETTADEAGDVRWGALRHVAKRINFGLIYGMTSIGLAAELKIDETVAQTYIDRYFSRMEGVAEWAARQRKEGRQSRSVRTLFGRRLLLERARDRAGGSYAERQAMNFPIQGGAADLMRLAMVRVARDLDALDAESALLLTVHDELLIEAAECDAEAVRSAVVEAMVHCADDWIDWQVPIVVGAKIGRNWAGAH